MFFPEVVPHPMSAVMTDTTEMGQNVEIWFLREATPSASCYISLVEEWSETASFIYDEVDTFQMYI